MTRSFLSLLALVAVSAAASIPRNLRSEISPRAAARDNSGLSPGCENTPTSRKCWGEYDINTNPYDNVFYTGRTVEYWLNIEEIDCAPDGYQRKCMVANGTMPGPAIVADWGDNIIVHVTNNVPTNGTSIHWHGMRQLNNNQYDGAPGVTQCPLAPGQSMSYKFHASQYGTAMYHSHFSVQYSMGLYGPLVINGPATADYDEDLGTVFMNDWGHETEFYRWATVDNFNVSFEGAPTGLVNGMNTGNCTLVNATNPDPLCVGKGKKFELAFEAGKKYRIRFINLATEAWFHPSIDGHNMTVISNDLVPIVPYETDGVLINMGQRYDVIVEANAVPGDYWFRSGFIAACIPNGNADGITGIVRYNKNSTAEPTTVSTTPQIDTCLDEPTSRLVPWVPITVPNMRGGLTFSNVTGEYFQGKFLRWSFNKPSGGFLLTNWSQPALGDVYDNEMTNIPVTNNIFTVGVSAFYLQFIALIVGY
jgi:FtsP/CotA-like multicopper oxidase with cupredoxin domain